MEVWVNTDGRTCNIISPSYFRGSFPRPYQVRAYYEQINIGSFPDPYDSTKRPAHAPDVLDIQLSVHNLLVAHPIDKMMTTPPRLHLRLRLRYVRQGRG